MRRNSAWQELKWQELCGEVVLLTRLTDDSGLKYVVLQLSVRVIISFGDYESL